ncbi:protein serine/threonine phosphatase 2C [Terfezia boudieri ATCC MYA-4762]|uniref:Protein serine/threonine phosphatase 2C n=1 Tax=Terfezia boudieri ATCC MYA-4762 TaxID=1051890 RepID=A0A3N4M6G9_9PEZI|nr:protein serine/threonine phosphatase 2C [Terfezia boudieri ATCC MYA-4762]
MQRASARALSRVSHLANRRNNTTLSRLTKSSPSSTISPLSLSIRRGPVYPSPANVRLFSLSCYLAAQPDLSMHSSSSKGSIPGSSRPPMKFNNLAIGLAASTIVLGGAVWYSTKTPKTAVEVEQPYVSPPATAIEPPTTPAPQPPQPPQPQPERIQTDELLPPPDPSLRRIVAVDEESLYTASLPVSKKIEDTGGKKVLAMLSPEEATAKLRSNEESYNIGRGSGVWRYDVVQIPSNNPIEDDHSEKIIEVPAAVAPAEDGKNTSDWMFWGVFDGHSGWTTSAKLRQVLIGFVARELNETYKATKAPEVPSPEAIDAAIKRGFVSLDNDIVHESVKRVLSNPTKLMAAETLAPALSGSCGLLAFYESRSKLLRVACTGDSRAVLGRRQPNGMWTASALSADQTGSSPSEVERIRAEHPGEPHVIRNGRVLGGLEPTRAFGDAFYKWSYDVQAKIKNSFFGRTPSPLLKTPPYVTAEPVVTTTKIEPERGDFVVMATDGLWEMLTNEEVVGLVGRWLDEQQINPNGSSRPGSKSGWLGGWLGGKPQQVLPIEKPKTPTAEGKNGAAGEDGNKTPIRMLQWGITASDDERFVFEDRNAATHLVRNALGGKDRDMVCALLTLISPYSRRYRYVLPEAMMWSVVEG